MVELLTLRRRTNVDELVDSVPRPESGVPTYALPGWKEVALDLKLPMLKCPNNQIIFSRAKVGQKIWKKFKNAQNDFKIVALNSFQGSCHYQPLHDPHLKEFYKKKPFKEKIRAIGEVTSNNDVICKLKEFNEYRNYLKRVHVDSIIAQRNKEEEIIDCKYRLAKVEMYKRREEKLLEVLQLREINGKEKRLEVFKEKELHKMKLLESQKRVDDAYNRYKQITELKSKMLHEKSKKRQKYLKMRVNEAHQEELRRIILMKKRCHYVDSIRHTKLKAIQDEKLKQKRVLDDYRWHLHILFRELYQYKTSKILKKNAENIARNIDKRNACVRQQWEDIDNGIVAKKIIKIRKSYEKRGKKQMIKAIKHGIRKLMKKKRKSKKRKQVNSSEDEKVEEESTRDIHKTKESLLKLSNYDKSVSDEDKTLVLEKVSSKQLNDIVQTSMSYAENQQAKFNSLTVLMCAKKLLSKVNKNTDLSENYDCFTYTCKRVEEVMEIVTGRVLEAIKKVLQTACQISSSDNSVNKEEHKPVTMKKSTLSRPISQNYSKSGIVSGGVSFGNVTQIVHEIDDENEMKSIKDRIPTPVASLSSLAVTVLETPDIEENLQILPISMYDVIVEALTQEQILIIEYRLVKFKKELIKRVELRTFAGIDFDECRRIMKIHHDVLDIEKPYLINNMTTALLNKNKFSYASNFLLVTSYISFYILREIQNIINKHPGKLKKISTQLLTLNKCKRNI